MVLCAFRSVVNYTATFRRDGAGILDWFGVFLSGSPKWTRANSRIPSRLSFDNLRETQSILFMHRFAFSWLSVLDRTSQIFSRFQWISFYIFVFIFSSFRSVYAKFSGLRYLLSTTSAFPVSMMVAVWYCFRLKFWLNVCIADKYFYWTEPMI